MDFQLLVNCPTVVLMRGIVRQVSVSGVSD